MLKYGVRLGLGPAPSTWFGRLRVLDWDQAKEVYKDMYERLGSHRLVAEHFNFSHIWARKLAVEFGLQNMKRQMKNRHKAKFRLPKWDETK